MKSNFVALGSFVEEIRQRIGTEKKTVYSVTNNRGFIPSSEVFDKQVFSADISNYKLVGYNDLAYNPSRINVGSVAICPDENGGAVSPMYTIVRCKKELLPQYLLYFLRSEKGSSEINHRAEGAVRFQFKFKDLQRTPIYLPTISEQERIVRLLDEAESIRAARERANDRMEQFAPALLQEMFGDPETNPKKWETCLLSDVIKEGPQNGLYKHSSSYGSGSPILRIDSFYDGVITGFDSLKRLRVNPDEMERYKLQINDLVINRVNSPEHLGKSALVEELQETTLFESNIMRFTVDEKRLHPTFVVHYLQTSFIKQQILSRAKHAINQSSINQEDVKLFKIFIPPLALQREFAARVGEARGVQSAQGKSAERIEALYQSMLSRAFAGEL